MDKDNEIVTLPIETYTHTPSSTFSYIKEERYSRHTNTNEQKVFQRKNMIKKKGSHLSHKEISPTKFKEQFLDRIKECLESDIKERNNKKRKTIIYHSETNLNFNDKSYELSDISSLNLNSSKEEENNEEDDNSFEFHFVTEQ